MKSTKKMIGTIGTIKTATDNADTRPRNGPNGLNGLSGPNYPNGPKKSTLPNFRLESRRCGLDEEIAPNRSYREYFLFGARS